MAHDDDQVREPPAPSDLLVDAFWGRSAYRAAARGGMLRPLVAVVLMLGLVSLLLGVQQDRKSVV
jgi:hypothetical protein